MAKAVHFDHLLESGEFRFDQLHLMDIDNGPAKKFHGANIKEQEICLFHREVASGEDYLDGLHEFVHGALGAGMPGPVVRFADGEYAFYAHSLHCNGLYQQAESVEAIKKAMPMHEEALRALSRWGKIAPLIYPGNIRKEKNAVIGFLSRSRGNGLALKFLEFLFSNNIKLTRDSYLPFYTVYAYLTSKRFAKGLDGRKVCIISSECNLGLCQQWFARFSSHPSIISIKIPDSYIATRWGSIKEDVLASVPADAALCLVGAGIGALLVCVDVARAFSIPALDAGHILNMMNSREAKSLGPRLYTIHRHSVD